MDFVLRIVPGNYLVEATANDTVILELRHHHLTECVARERPQGLLSRTPPPLSLSLTLTHSFSHSLTQSLSLSHTHTRSLSLSL